MEQELEKLQSTLCSTLTTAHNLIDMKKYAAEPDEEIRSFLYSEDTDAVNGRILIDELVSFLTDAMRRAWAEEMADQDENLGGKLKALKNEMTTCLIVLNELGPWATYKVRRSCLLFGEI